MYSIFWGFAGFCRFRPFPQINFAHSLSHKNGFVNTLFEIFCVFAVFFLFWIKYDGFFVQIAPSVPLDHIGEYFPRALLLAPYITGWTQ